MIAFALLLAGMLSMQAHATENDSSQPVDVHANSFDSNASPNGVTHLIGNVIITQGTFKATSAKATVHFDAQSNVSRVVLMGAPAHLRQLDDNGNLIKGHANTIDYNIPTGIATLTGDAHVDQKNRGSASGDTLVYNTKTSTMTGHSQSGNRVHLTFQSSQKSKSKTTDNTNHPDKH